MSYYDRYIIKEGSLKNEVKDGEVIGYSFQVHVAQYRGLFVSLLRGYYVEVDGVEYPLDSQTFEVNGKVRTWDECAKACWEQWNYKDYATIHVAKPGGLEAGSHHIVIIQGGLNAYGWQPTDEEYAKNCPEPQYMNGMMGSPLQRFTFDMELA